LSQDKVNYNCFPSQDWDQKRSHAMGDKKGKKEKEKVHKQSDAKHAKADKEKQDKRQKARPV